MWHAQGIEIYCCFPNLRIIYPVGPVYYCPVHSSNTISSSYLQFYVGFKNIMFRPLEHCYFVNLEQFEPSLSWFCQSQPSTKNMYCGYDCMWPFQSEFMTAYSSTFLSYIDCHLTKNIKERTHEGSTKKSNRPGRNLSYLSLN